jgi:hypothetical protein
MAVSLITRQFGIFGDLVYFIVIWSIFSRFGMLYQEKSGNPAQLSYLPLPCVSVCLCLMVVFGGVFSRHIRIVRCRFIIVTWDQREERGAYLTQHVALYPMNDRERKSGSRASKQTNNSFSAEKDASSVVQFVTSGALCSLHTFCRSRFYLSVSAVNYIQGQYLV